MHRCDMCDTTKPDDEMLGALKDDEGAELFRACKECVDNFLTKERERSVHGERNV